MRLLFYDFRHFFLETFRIHFRGKYIFRQRVTFVVVLESRKKSFASRRISCPYPANANHFFYFLLFDINRRKQSYQTRFIKEQKSEFETVCIYLGKIALGEIGLFGALVGSFTKSRSQRTLEEGG